MPSRGAAEDLAPNARGSRGRGEGRGARAGGLGVQGWEAPGRAPQAPGRELLAHGGPGDALRGVPVRRRLPRRRRGWLDAGGVRRDGADLDGRRRGRAAVGRGARAGDHRGRPGGDPGGAERAGGDDAGRAGGAGSAQGREGVGSMGAHLRGRLEPSGRARDACASPGGAVVGARVGDAGGRDPRGVRLRRGRGGRPGADGCVRAAVVRPVGGVGAVRRDVPGARGGAR